MTDKTFLDTNVLVYLFDSRDHRKQQVARDLLDRLGDAGFSLSAQVLSEFFTISTRRLPEPLSTSDALLAVREFSQFEVVATDLSLVVAAIERSSRYQMSYWDALMLGAAIRADCQVVVTEDLDAGMVVDGVRIENPFILPV